MTHFERFYFFVRTMRSKQWELSRMYLSEDQAKDGIFIAKIGNPCDEFTEVRSIKIPIPQPKKARKK